MNTKAIEALIFAAALALLVGAAWVKGSHHGAAGVQAKWDAAKAAQTKVVLQRTVEVATINQQQDAKAQKVDSHVQEQIRIVVADHDRAVSDLASLRDELSRVRADAMSQATTRARLAADLASTSDSLSECSTSYASVASQSDQMSVQISGLLELLPSE